MQRPIPIYFGTYTQPPHRGRGIYRATMDLNSSAVSSSELAVEAMNPSFVAAHPSGRFLYAVGEVDQFDAQATGFVAAYAIEPSGRLALINQQPSQGTSPCHLALDAAGRSIIVSNYSSGSVCVLPIDDAGHLGKPIQVIQDAVTSDSASQGGASVLPPRQPHAHSATFDPAWRFVFIADLGLDRIFGYRIEQGGMAMVGEVKLPDGSGPRHFVFHPTGRFAYVINELASTVMAFGYGADRGLLRPLQTLSTLPAGFSAWNAAAEVQIHPNGKFLYGSNRGYDSIVIFAIDAGSGNLTPVGHQLTLGKTPRHFAIAPGGDFLLVAHQDSDNLVVFRIDGQTGQLNPTGSEISVPSPVCVKFMA